MFSKVLSSIIILVVLYILGIFLAPVLTDSVGESLGIREMNEKIRGFKSGVDSTSDTLLQIQDGSGAINGVRGVVDRANTQIQQTQDTINTIRSTGERKVQQVEKTIDSVQKAGQAIQEVRSNVSELTSFSGATVGSGRVSSGSTKSGSGK